MSPFRDREIITPDDEDDIADARAEAREREICRGDYLADELRDRQAEEREAAKPRVIACPPRFFREPSTGYSWVFRNGEMTNEDGEKSIFKSPAEILEVLDVIEVDEYGNRLELSAEDIAAAKGDAAQQIEADES